AFDSPVTAAALHSTDKGTYRLATGHEDGSTVVRDPAAGKPALVLRQEGPVTALAVNDTLVVTAGKDGVRLWRAATGEPGGGPLPLAGPALGVALPAADRVLAWTAAEVRLWDDAGRPAGPAVRPGTPVRGVTLVGAFGAASAPPAVV